MNINAESETRKLLTKVYAFLSGVDHPPLRTLLETLPAADSTIKSWAPVSFPVVNGIHGIIQKVDSRFSQLGECLEQLAIQLHWLQSYSKQDFGGVFLRNYAYTELVGLRGPWHSEVIACGLFIIGPGQIYPNHSHEAEEYYFPLIDGTEWQQNSGNWVVKNAGDWVHNTSWQPHAIRTLENPMLVVYLWYGGKLVQKSKIL